MTIEAEKQSQSNLTMLVVNLRMQRASTAAALSTEHSKLTASIDDDVLVLPWRDRAPGISGMLVNNAQNPQ